MDRSKKILILLMQTLPDLAQKFQKNSILELMIKNKLSLIIVSFQFHYAKASTILSKEIKILLRQTKSNQKQRGILRFQSNSNQEHTQQHTSKEFTINIKEGQLKPTQQTLKQVTFKPIKKQKFSHTWLHKIFKALTLKTKQKKLRQILVQLKFPNVNKFVRLWSGVIKLEIIKIKTLQ